VNLSSDSEMNGQDGTGNGKRENCDVGGETSLAHAISGDGHQFLQHMLSLEGEELQKLLSGMGSCGASSFKSFSKRCMSPCGESSGAFFTDT